MHTEGRTVGHIVVLSNKTPFVRMLTRINDLSYQFYQNLIT